MARKAYKLPGRVTSKALSLEYDVGTEKIVDESFSGLDDVELEDFIRSIDPTGFFLDFYRSGFSLKIYSELHNISYDAAKMRLSRARRKINWDFFPEHMLDIARNIAEK